MPEIDRACREVRKELVALAASASTGSRIPAHCEAHLQNCESCRLYSEGLQTAPLLFAGGSLYGPALRHRCLTAISASGRTGDFKLGLLLAPPLALCLLSWYLVQAYLVNWALSKVLDCGLLSWIISFTAVWTLWAAAGGICVSVLTRRHGQGNGFREVFHG